MEFSPKTEREIRDAMVLPAGEYDFEVAEAEDKTSKNGNEMIELQLRVFGEDGGARMVKDWLLPTFELKLNRFCRAVGLSDAYETGTLDAFACKQMSGKLKLGVEDSAEYGKQNRVKDYVAPEIAPEEFNQDDPGPPTPKGVPAAQTRAARAAGQDDDIPF